MLNTDKFHPSEGVNWYERPVMFLRVSLGIASASVVEPVAPVSELFVRRKLFITWFSVNTCALPRR